MDTRAVLAPLVSRLDMSPWGVVCASGDGRTVFANRRIRQMVGLVPPGVPAEVWGESFGLANIDGRPYKSASEIPLMRALEEGDVRVQMLSRDGPRASVLDCVTTPVVDVGGRCLGSVGVFHTRRRLDSTPSVIARRPAAFDDTSTPRPAADGWLLLAAAETLSSQASFAGENTMAERAYRLIEERYTETWSLNAIAAELHVHPHHLTAVVSAEYGEGVMRRLARVRVEEAARLLTSTDLSVVAVGRRVGLCDPQRFARTFRRLRGMSPRAYRASTR